jgi:hypothetical protein
MGWNNQIKNWKLMYALLLILLLCGHTALHVEPRFPIYDGPTTVSTIQASGANVAVGTYSWSSNGSRSGGA